jgi:succinyl-CoA synthetase alpha subunit
MTVASFYQVEALKSGVITKPVVAWVSGTCAQLFRSEVQFGHAGARSGGAQESAQVPAACGMTWRCVKLRDIAGAYDKTVLSADGPAEMALLLQGKNAALREAGAIVSESFEGFEGAVAKV